MVAEVVGPPARAVAKRATVRSEMSARSQLGGSSEEPEDELDGG